MKLIVGLGNPGTKYEKTRHNLGAMVVEQLLKDVEPVEKTVWENNAKLKSDIAIFVCKKKGKEEKKIILAKPKTYMNNSGMAVSLISLFYKIKPADIWVVYDELDLPLGSMKIRFGGASAGHHGIDSIIEKLGTDKFWRFRMGIGRQNSKFKIQSSKFDRRVIKHAEDIVLGRFTGAEWGKARELVKRGAKALHCALEDGLEAAMNRYNTK